MNKFIATIAVGVATVGVLAVAPAVNAAAADVMKVTTASSTYDESATIKIKVVNAAPSCPVKFIMKGGNWIMGNSAKANSKGVATLTISEGPSAPGTYKIIATSTCPGTMMEPVKARTEFTVR